MLHHIHVLQYEGADVIGVVQVISALRGVLSVTEVMNIWWDYDVSVEALLYCLESCHKEKW